MLKPVREQERHRYRKSIDLEWPPANINSAWRRARVAVDLWLESLVVEEEPSEDEKPEDKPKKLSPTVDEFWAEYAAWKIKTGDWGSRYRYSAASSYRKWVKPYFGHLRLNAVTPQDLTEWRVLMANNLTIKTLKSRWMVFKSMFEFAKALDAQEAFIGSSPYRLRHNVSPFSGVILTKLKKGGGTEKKPIAFSKEELDSIMRSTKTRFPTLYPMVVLAVRTGMRIGEIKGLRWSDIEWNDDKPSIINVNRSVTTDARGVDITDGKTTNAVRRVPMSQDLEKIMRGWLKEAPSTKDVLSMCIRHRSNNPHAQWVLKQRGQPKGSVQIATDREGYCFVSVRTWVKGDMHTGILNTTRLSSKLKTVAQLAGLEKINGWHDFRHSWISHAVAQGLDWKWIQSVVGHSDLKTTMGYTHLVDKADHNIEKVFSGPDSDPRGTLEK